MEWDHEKRRFIAKLWPTHSASVIALKINEMLVSPVNGVDRNGEKCNRNMVIGIVHRMQRKNDLQRKGTGILPKVNKRTPRAPPREKKVRTGRPHHGGVDRNRTMPMKSTSRPHAGTVPLNTAPCPLLELDDSRCHWPLGEVHKVAVLFCGAVSDGWPYCAHHTQLAYVRDRRAA
jgi:hypothetical protein